MFDIEQIRTLDKDVIYDLAYDQYARRMATCSSEQTIKIWELTDQDKWDMSASWKAHSGSIWRISWAHPEFGQLIATCSFDRTASIWEEIIDDKATSTTEASKRWIKRVTLSDSRGSVTDVKFSPKFLGLLLATASSDGIIRIYEATDILNLTQWSIQHEISCKLPLSCVSWNSSMYMLPSPLIAAGSDETAISIGKVFIFEYSENARKWTRIETLNSITEPVNDIGFARNVGRSFHVLSVASKDLYILYLKSVPEPTGNSRLDIQTVAQFNDHNCPVWRVCWNITGTMLASSGDDGCVRIWRKINVKTWSCVSVLKSEGCQPIPLQLSNAQNSIAGPSSSATTKYYKQGIISKPNQVPYH